MTHAQTVGIVGYGNMGRAFVRGLKQAQVGSVLVFDRSADQLADLTERERAESVADVFNRSAVVLIAVKPQQLADLVSELSATTPSPLVISILAGVPMKRLIESFRTDRLVRAMPNLAATVAESVTGWVAGPGVSAADEALTKQLLSAVGFEVRLENDAAIDALTAVAGSGPGYLMAVAEAMTAGAMQAGFSAQSAGEIVRQTMVGVGRLLASDDRSFTDLKRAVTSKGGTTEAALAAMPETELTALIRRAMTAALDRASELGRSV